MIDQINTSSTPSPKDSFLSNSKVYHTKPIRPPRSNASRSQRDAPTPATLTAEALANLPSTDKNEAAAHIIKEFLHRLPDPENPSNSPPYTDLDILEAEFHHHHYCDDDDDAAKEGSIASTPTPKAPNTPRKVKPEIRHYNEADILPYSPTRRLSTTIPSTQPPQSHRLLLSTRDMHLYHRFQVMLSSEKYADFWRHRACLTLQYDKDKRVALFVGVHTQAHAVEIHGHMLWLRNKWFGLGVGLFYHVMGSEDGEDGKEKD